jgi:hypothetical protein
MQACKECVWKIYVIQIGVHFSISVFNVQVTVMWRPGYGLDDQDLITSSDSDGIFSLYHHIRPAVGPTQPPIQWVLGILNSGKVAAT